MPLHECRWLLLVAAFCVCFCGATLFLSDQRPSELQLAPRGSGGVSESRPPSVAVQPDRSRTTPLAELVYPAETSEQSSIAAWDAELAAFAPAQDGPRGQAVQSGVLMDRPATDSAGAGPGSPVDAWPVFPAEPAELAGVLGPASDRPWTHIGNSRPQQNAVAAADFQALPATPQVASVQIRHVAAVAEEFGPIPAPRPAPTRQPAVVMSSEVPMVTTVSVVGFETSVRTVERLHRDTEVRQASATVEGSYRIRGPEPRRAVQRRLTQTFRFGAPAVEAPDRSRPPAPQVRGKQCTACGRVHCQRCAKLRE